MTFSQRVYEDVKRVPLGKVTTYGDVAKRIGAPKMSRYVGYVLHRNPSPVVIPCHRVVFSDGRLSPAFAFGGPDVQGALLVSEGVEVSDGYVTDFEKLRWDGE